eukprot:NODE_6576_length_446_cov_165.783375_g5012_i0.p4 GENE.NODE_6576_length_446_cov_165.783375_g5012_i0~~NODE_6576_length_446_cov_165.783375_g5012_i0.p4  ORF type:complete len:58 (-),score=22.83 NODE_6576_length_446_cov_165.783375_g5012_i0:272-415(-)
MGGPERAPLGLVGLAAAGPAVQLPPPDACNPTGKRATISSPTTCSHV